MMSDGEPTDEYKKGLEELRKNKWFKMTIKVAVAIGANANTEITQNDPVCQRYCFTNWQ